MAEDMAAKYLLVMKITMEDTVSAMDMPVARAWSSKSSAMTIMYMLAKPEENKGK